MRIYLLSRPQFDVETFLGFLEDAGQGEWRRTPDALQPEEIVEAAGRVCYMSFGARQSPRSCDEYIRNLIQQGHESVLEHVSWTFLLTGVSRAFTHQLVRHRVGFAFSQLSQQYHEETDASFIEPCLLHEIPGAHAAWTEAMRLAKKSYIDILKLLQRQETDSLSGLDAKEAARAMRSAARSVLPNATETKIVMTANARALRHFLKVRGAIEGDEEMRVASAELLRCLQSEAPAIFNDFSLEHLEDGSPMVVIKQPATVSRESQA